MTGQVKWTIRCSCQACSENRFSSQYVTEFEYVYKCFSHALYEFMMVARHFPSSLTGTEYFWRKFISIMPDGTVWKPRSSLITCKMTVSPKDRIWKTNADWVQSDKHLNTVTNSLESAAFHVEELLCPAEPKRSDLKPLTHKSHQQHWTPQITTDRDWDHLLITSMVLQGS